jgi:hypothetical protein
MAPLLLLPLLFCAAGPAVRAFVLPRGCVEVAGPTTLAANTHRIQTALDTASASGTANAKGCVSVAVGDWYVAGVTVRSNTTLLIQPDARLVSKINVTTTAVLQVDKAEHVEIGGGGGVHGHAEEAWLYFSDKVRRHGLALPRGSLRSGLRHVLACGQSVALLLLRPAAADVTGALLTTTDQPPTALH